MKTGKMGKRGCKLLVLGAVFILALALSGIPTGMASAQGGPVPPHLYWGHVTTTEGQPASEVEVTAWIDGELRGSITTDASGNYGMVSLAYYMAVTGYNGDIIEFQVDGVVAQETRLGILIEEADNRYWEWQDLAPAWQAVYDAEEVNGLDLVYTPTAPPPEEDVTPPAAITNLSTGSATNNSITLNWTAPGDDDNQGTADQYDIRYLKNSPVTASNWNTASQAGSEPGPKSAGLSESSTVAGLNAGTTYYFAIKTGDEVPNWSAISNSPSGTTTGEADTTLPAAITNLSTGGTTGNSVTLTWTAPGDDDNQGTADQYDIRYREGSAVTATNWNTASQVNGEPGPKSAGLSESFTVAGLDASTTYYFAIKTGDEVPNWSAISNSPSGTTTGEADATPPTAITNLSTGSASSSSITLNWTAPGDDGNQGTADQYDIRYLKNSPVTATNWNTASQVTGEPGPKSAGLSESFTVSGLGASTTYYFAIKTGDEVPNWSTISNSPSGTTTSSGGGAGFLGGGGGSALETMLEVQFPGGIIKKAEITSYGRVMEEIVISIPGVIKVTIAKNTRAYKANGDALETIKATIMADPPGAPTGKVIIQPVLNFTPKGATFDPPMLMVMDYDPIVLTEKNVDEDSLVIAFYDEDAAQWMPLESILDKEASTVSAYISHFTPFAIMGTIIPPAPAPTAPAPVITMTTPEAEPPKPALAPQPAVQEEVAEAVPLTPALLTVTNLVIYPDFVVTGGEADIFVDVTNTGEEEGSYAVELKINGLREDTRTITVAGGVTETITFSTSKDFAGDYIVEVDGRSATLRVSTMTRWALIAGIIGGAFIVGLLIFLIRRLFFVRQY